MEVRLDSLAYGGDAVGRADGRVVFVPFGAPGDLVEVAVTEEQRRFAKGEIAELKERSPQRTEPPCPYFGVCGGCHWQHLDYEAQLSAKRTLVIDALQRIGKLTEVEVRDTIPRRIGCATATAVSSFSACSAVATRPPALLPRVPTTWLMSPIA